MHTYVVLFIQCYKKYVFKQAFRDILFCQGYICSPTLECVLDMPVSIYSSVRAMYVVLTLECVRHACVYILFCQGYLQSLLQSVFRHVFCFVLYCQACLQGLTVEYYHVLSPWQLSVSTMMCWLSQVCSTLRKPRYFLPLRLHVLGSFSPPRQHTDSPCSSKYYVLSCPYDYTYWGVLALLAIIADHLTLLPRFSTIVDSTVCSQEDLA